MQNSWDDFWKTYDINVYASWAKKRIISILSDYVTPGINVLDAGCGSGFFSSYFISCGCNVYSMDYSEGALSITRNATGHKSRMYLSGDILSKSFFSAIDSRFDIIFTDGLLEHYSKDEQDMLIMNMRGVKKKHGYMINFVPNKFSLWSLVRPFYMCIREQPFMMKGFLNLHTRNNLKAISCGGINVLPCRISPERMLSKYLGMLLYCVSI